MERVPLELKSRLLAFSLYLHSSIKVVDKLLVEYDRDKYGFQQFGNNMYVELSRSEDLIINSWKDE